MESPKDRLEEMKEKFESPMIQTFQDVGFLLCELGLILIEIINEAKAISKPSG